MTPNDPPIRACVFDAYGTLFDVHSAVAKHAARLGPDAAALSQTWRTKQLEYSWVHSLMHRYEDFWTLTTRALDFAFARHGVHDDALRADLLAAYETLDAYAEVPAVLAQLRGAGLQTAILSNGAPAMLASAVRSAGLDGAFDALLSVDSLRRYKPDPRVYALATDRFGLLASEIAFMSSNAWDVAGARAFGFDVHWINRTQQPAEYPRSAAADQLPDLTALLGHLGLDA
ncbi:MAG: haloacid dehalogenase type II [Burkholderiales bacterium]|nr:haloacid dehalogenase type II [Burkholderiales bacterium]